MAVCRCDGVNMYQWFTLSQVPKVHIFLAGMKKPAQWRAAVQIGEGRNKKPGSRPGILFCRGRRRGGSLDRNRKTFLLSLYLLKKLSRFD